MNITPRDNFNSYSIVHGSRIFSGRFSQEQTFNGIGNFFQKIKQSGLDEALRDGAKNIVEKKSVKKLFQNEWFNNNILKKATENPGVFEAIVALGITCLMRPATILSMPGAKREDKEYAAAQSVASGIVGFGFAYAVFEPITESVKKVFKHVNEKNVLTVFKDLYENPANESLVNRLVSKEIIPDKTKFFEELDKKNSNPYKILKKFLETGTNGKKNIETMLQGTKEEIASWKKLAKEYSDVISNSFERVKYNDIDEKCKYMVHKSLEFLPEGIYNLKQSDTAGKILNLCNYTSKFVLFPLLAAATIVAIPKIMRIVFPNHKKSKQMKNSVPNTVVSPMQNKYKNLKTADNVNMGMFKNFSRKPATGKGQVSFSGNNRNILKAAYETVYENGYEDFVSNILSKGFKKLLCGDKGFSWFTENFIKYCDKKATSIKHGLEVFVRDEKTGKILKNIDKNWIFENAPDIVAVSGTCLYIRRTIKNKDIDPERKPALCTNMGLVALFSLYAGSRIRRWSKPVFEVFQEAHKKLYGDKINYNVDGAWEWAKKLMTTTFAFRYLGPVFATPVADKLVKLFNKRTCNYKNEIKK